MAKKLRCALLLRFGHGQTGKNLYIFSVFISKNISVTKTLMWSLNITVQAVAAQWDYNIFLSVNNYIYLICVLWLEKTRKVISHYSIETTMWQLRSTVKMFKTFHICNGLSGFEMEYFDHSGHVSKWKKLLIYSCFHSQIFVETDNPEIRKIRPKYSLMLENYWIHSTY